MRSPFVPGEASNLDGALLGALPREDLAWAAAMGVPAFVRRANALEQAIEKLHHGIRAEKARRLRHVHAAARGLDASRRAGLALPPGIHAALDEIAGEPSFRPAAPGRLALSPRRARVQAERLRRRIAEFNARWAEYLATVPLDEVRSLQGGYNRWYPLERELAVRGVRMPFTPVPLLERGDIIQMHPGLQEIDPTGR